MIFSRMLIFFAKRFFAGINFSDAVNVIKRLQENGLKVTIDHLGEEVTNKEKANNSVKRYIKLLENIKSLNLDADISIKLSQIGLSIDKNLALRNAEKILERAKLLKLFVEIDMESSKYTEDTINIFLKLLNKYKNSSLCIQAYLFRSKKDVLKLIKSNAIIRLVKGAYKENKSISFAKKEDVNKNYINLMKLYLNKGKFIKIATHDEEIINVAKSYIKKMRVNKNKFEFEMLYGIRPQLQERLVSQGYSVRVYVPYGKEWFSYVYRRLRERKENLFFAIRHLFRR